jgi:beta-lactamase class A
MRPLGRRPATMVALAALLTGAVMLSARADTPAATIEELLTTDQPAAERFTAHFLAALPAAEIGRVIAGLRAEYGALQRVEQKPDGGLIVHFERATLPATISLDGEGRIAGLWFGAPVIGGAIADLAATIRALPGRTALLVLTDGEPVVADSADAPLAVGSAAKLAILAALDAAVSEGRLGWDTVVPLEAKWKSLPSGQLQDWPAGTPVTVATLANLMISVSDNTATDALIALVGRAAIEAVTPANAPFPTTREFFTLKTASKSGLRASWATADADGRRAILSEIADAPLPATISPDITHEVEWFMTARELCALLDRTATLPAVAINPGVADRGSWEAIAYKGGSETGVLNLSTRLAGTDGKIHCVVASWNNDAPLDDDRLFAPYRAILARLAASAKD